MYFASLQAPQESRLGGWRHAAAGLTDVETQGNVSKLKETCKETKGNDAKRKDIRKCQEILTNSKKLERRRTCKET